MNAAPPSTADERRPAWHRRLHAALMPDYNRLAALYWWVMATLGAATLLVALHQIIALPLDALAQVVGGIVIAMLAGMFPVRVPRSKHSFAAGEIFIFLLLLMHGPAAAALAAASEGFVGALRTSKRWTSRILTPAMAAVAMTASGAWLQGAGNATTIILAMMACALLYFVINTLLVAALPYLKRKQWPSAHELFGHFGWIAITYVGSASVACLLFLTYRASGLAVLMAAAPIIAMLLSTLHFYFRHQAADEEVRKGRLDAAEREAELAARHMHALQQLAFHDALTGLPNRRAFHDQLADALDRLGREGTRQFGLMFLDFDRFKLINDSLGHAVGDEFLIQVARRIREQVRPFDVVARLGGDEFAVLVTDVTGERCAVMLAERLLETLRHPFDVMGHDITTSASIGITFSTIGYPTPADMLRDADTAMYKAKAAGKARYALFDNGLHREVSERLRLEGDLRRALAAGQLEAVYQPLLQLDIGRVTGFEALCRWQHPMLGEVSPTSFVPIAEDAGLITTLTDFMLRSACAQLREWQRRDARFAKLTVHVNVSGHDLAHPGFVARVMRALVEAHLEPQYLTLELTENILMERLEAALPMLLELRRLGVGLSVDDFGTGYSSLRHLSALPVTSLKIDRAFVGDLRHGADGATVMRAIVALGQSLGKTVIAEGIETDAQLAQVRLMGCTAGQGYLLSPPLDVKQVDRLLDGLVVDGVPLARVVSAGAARLVH